MTRTLFLCMILREFSEVTNNKPILVCTIFYTITNISCFSVKEVSKIRNNVVCVVVRLVFLFCCALTTGRCNAFQHIFLN